MGELSERLPEGGGVGDRHLRPQEDHEGNPDRLWQSRQTKEKVKVRKKKNAAKKQRLRLFILRVNQNHRRRLQQSSTKPKKNFFSNLVFGWEKTKSCFRKTKN